MKYFYFILLFIIFGCSKVQQKKSIINDFNLTVLDSFYIDQAPLHFQDVRNNKLLFYNIVSNDIVIYDLKNKKMKSFNSYGDAYDQYGRLKDQNIKFLNDSTIGVGKIKSVNFYNLNGDFKEYYTINNPDAMSINGLGLLGDSLLLGQINKRGNFTKKEFYEGKHYPIFKKNLNNLLKDLNDENTFSLFGQFPESTSDLSSQEFYYYGPHTSYTYIDKSNNTYSIINRVDTKLFTYDIYSGKLIKTNSFDLQEFKPMKFPMKKKFDESKSVIYLFMDSGIYGYYHYDDLDFILYRTGLREQEVVDFKENNSGFPYQTTPESQYWIHVSKDGEKLINDRNLKNSIGPVLGVLDSDKILIGEYATEKNQRKKGNFFYIASFINSAE